MENQQNTMGQDQKDFGFTLNGKEYKYNDCTEEEQVLVQQLNDLQNQIGELEFKHNQVSGAKNHFTDLLVKSIESKDSKKEEESKETAES